jgi:outer membrane protein insertion porin family
MFKRFITPIVVISSLGASSGALADTFTVQKIVFHGLQRVTEQTALSYLPVSVGQSFDMAKSSELIKDLYKTSFFTDVSVHRDGSTLVIDVKENPVIGNIKISGCELIPKDTLKDVMKKAGLQEGLEYDAAALDKFVDSLQQQYYSMGRYNAKVATKISDVDKQGRVSIQIDVSEGRVAKIEQIQIIGNHVFSERELIKQLDIATTNIVSFFTKEDEYSSEKLDSSANKLVDFYQDHGYLHAKIDSAQSALSPKRDAIYVTFKVTEGDQYKVSSIKILGNTILPLADFKKMLKLKSGDIFSKAKLTETQKAMTDALGNKGYAFANIAVTPTIDEQNKTVALSLFVDPGKRVYIHHITFTGNNQTSDIVLRRESRQLEGSLSSTSNIKETERRIKNLGPYIQDAKSEVVPVPGKPDQVDLHYTITESPPATAVGQVSYGTNGWGFGASLNNYNLLGTGKALSLSFNKQPYVTSYNLTYFNPYYTFDGISRSVNVYAQRFDPGAVNIANYSYQNFGGAVTYGVPISEKNDQITFGYGYENSKIGVGSAPSLQVLDFFNQFNVPSTSNLIFDQALLNLGWNRNGLDRANFPTEGLMQTANSQLSLPLGQHKLKYYKLGYNTHWYHPIVKDFIFSALAGVNYGNGFGGTQNLPFFQNYYAGGAQTNAVVRGFENNSLGPIDSLGNSLGGNMAVNGSVAVIFPNFISPDRLRTSWFVDTGNVYNTHAATAITGGSSDAHAGPLRYSTGLDVEWRVPVVGMIDFSFADPLNARKEDKKQWFNFNFGTQF